MHNSDLIYVFPEGALHSRTMVKFVIKFYPNESPAYRKKMVVTHASPNGFGARMIKNHIISYNPNSHTIMYQKYL
jgi:hypothetical protein